MQRRDFLRLSLGAALIEVSARAGAHVSGAQELKIGYQTNGVLVIARQQASLERKRAPRGIAVAWSEFTNGPPLLEARAASFLHCATANRLRSVKTGAILTKLSANLARPVDATPEAPGADRNTFSMTAFDKN